MDIHTIDKKVGKWEIGYWLHSSYTSRGIISKSVQAICNLAFNEFGLNKLSIFADVENLPSNRVAQKCGFSLTSIEQQDALLYGKLRDMNHYTLLKEQYEKGFDE
ncbi:GNAT family N-acetyltransferase [Enterococcus malodoratus]|uniref:GNAT family N-acetyltransferase n=1 Tax=Enterococcus malodoratus TaxID=71451 RepID=UPI0023EE2B2A|nr:GNAT family protein [Enterococcus malodoratus]